MKKSIFLLAALMLPMYACQKNEVEIPSKEKAEDSAVSLFASLPETKTELQDGFKLIWTDTDALSVFNKVGEEYSDNCRFVISDKNTGKFVKDNSETGKSLLEVTDNAEWYICSPWMQYGAKPNGTKGYTIDRAPKQVGYGNSTHLASSDLMLGKSTGVSKDQAPLVQLKHVGALMVFDIKNATSKEVSITGLSLDASQGGTYITGSFTADWDNLKLDATQMGSAKSYLSELTINDQTGEDDNGKPILELTTDTVQPDASVKVYMIVAPFTIDSGKSIGITIKGTAGECKLTKTFSSEFKVEAGTYNTASVEYKPEKIVFTENWGTKTVAYNDIANYTKSGLTTAVPEHKESYSYSATRNISIAISTTNNGGINNSNYVPSVISGAAVKIPNASNCFIMIKNVIVKDNTTYIFRYSKSKGIYNSVEFDTTTQFKWRKTGTTTWSNVNSTDAAGVIEQEFTTGTDTTIEIAVQATAWTASGTPSIYPAVDNFVLIEK